MRLDELSHTFVPSGSSTCERSPGRCSHHGAFEPLGERAGLEPEAEGQQHDGRGRGRAPHQTAQRGAAGAHPALDGAQRAFDVDLFGGAEPVVEAEDAVDLAHRPPVGGRGVVPRFDFGRFGGRELSAQVGGKAFFGDLRCLHRDVHL